MVAGERIYRVLVDTLYFKQGPGECKVQLGLTAQQLEDLLMVADDLLNKEMCETKREVN